MIFVFIAGYYVGEEDYYTHTRESYLDLHDNMTPVKNQTGVYSAHLFAMKAQEVIIKHASLTKKVCSNKATPTYLIIWLGIELFNH